MRMGTVLDRRTIKARKTHQCYWCGEPIPAGTTYAQWKWACDGSIDTVRTHVECRDAWNTVASEEPDGLYGTGPGEHRRGVAYEEGAHG